MANLKSSTGAATAAVGGFQKVEFSPLKASVNQSTPVAMKNGQKIAESVYKSVEGLNQKMLELAEAIPAYAQKVETDDLKDSQMISQAVPPTFESSKPQSIF